jgi:hypothetical protein
MIADYFCPGIEPDCGKTEGQSHHKSVPRCSVHEQREDETSRHRDEPCVLERIK